VWRWPSTSSLPASLQLAQPAAAGTNAVVQFDSAIADSPRLPVGLARRLYRVVKEAVTDHEDRYALQPLGEGAPLSTTDLYLDEVTVTPGRSPVRFAIVEVPLPPGASVESTTWGVNFADAQDELKGLEAARHQATRFGYSVPVDDVGAETRIRHLVRFAQKGTFAVPRARLYRMYQPVSKASEGGTSLRRMEVR
jgi:uncharacterized protein YfaS (alpha-2-macroglobulin family)